MENWREGCLAVLLVTLLLAPVTAHEGHNHSLDAQEEREGPFESLYSEYPSDLVTAVIAETLLVLVLLALSIRHYRRNS